MSVATSRSRAAYRRSPQRNQNAHPGRRRRGREPARSQRHGAPPARTGSAWARVSSTSRPASLLRGDQERAYILRGPVTCEKASRSCTSVTWYSTRADQVTVCSASLRSSSLTTAGYKAHGLLAGALVPGVDAAHGAGDGNAPRLLDSPDRHAEVVGLHHDDSSPGS